MYVCMIPDDRQDLHYTIQERVWNNNRSDERNQETFFLLARAYDEPSRQNRTEPKRISVDLRTQFYECHGIITFSPFSLSSAQFAYRPTCSIPLLESQTANILNNRSRSPISSAAWPSVYSLPDLFERLSITYRPEIFCISDPASNPPEPLRREQVPSASSTALNHNGTR
jgi:hypothetical protein